MYKHLSQSRTNFQTVVYDVYVNGIAVTMAIFLFFKLLSKLFYKSIIGQALFKNITSHWMLVVWIFSPRISFIAFHFFV